MPTIGRIVGRPWQIYALTALWAIKGADELFRGVIGTSFYVWDQAQRGMLRGYGLQLAFQSLFFSATLAAGSFYVMGALWLGRKAARIWGVLFGILGELSVLAYLVTRPPEFGGDVPLVRTVVIATIVNLSVIAFLLFDGKLAAFLGSTRLIGGWAPQHPTRSGAVAAERSEEGEGTPRG
jgi:hypothetical protein